jgi:hypothetical protein
LQRIVLDEGEVENLTRSQQSHQKKTKNKQFPLTLMTPREIQTPLIPSEALKGGIRVELGRQLS